MPSSSIHEARWGARVVAVSGTVHGSRRGRLAQLGAASSFTASAYVKRLHDRITRRNVAKKAPESHNPDGVIAPLEEE
jgi:hypothetical protein